MACLAPQFKWAPSPSAAHATSSSSSRCSALRVHCAVTSAAAAVVEADRANGGGALGLLYASPGPASAFQRTFESTLASEVLLNEEAVVAAAAAEAVALARAAAEAACEVVRMVQNKNEQPVIRQKKGVDNYLANEILRTEMESSISNEYVNDILLEDLESYGIIGDEGELDDDAQHTENIVVKSARQSERRARRTRAATKAATSVRASQKTATSSKKKRSKGSSTSMNPLGSLWKMTGRRLLTAKEEVEFSQGIQDLLKLEAIQAELTEYNGGQPSFSQWATAAGIDEKTLRRRLDHGIYCKNRMVTSNVRLVISIAREFEGPRMDLYDLIQEGMQGLIRGAEKFDASKGFRFSTYSHWWIKQAMRKSVSEQSHIFRLPAHMVEASYRVKECMKRLRRKLKRRPTNEEIAVDTGMPIKRVEAAVNLPKYSVSLDSKIGSTDMTYQEVTADPSAETAEEMLNRMSIDVRLGSLTEVCPQEGEGHQNVITKLLRFSSTADQGSSGSPSATCSYDVYCFGKVLLELVTGRLAISASNDAATSEWLDNTLRYINIYEKELMSKIIDPTLIIDEDHLEEVWAMAIVAKSCLNPRSSKRPPMKYILKALENPLKVVREDNGSSSARLRATSSRGSWNAVFFGSWQHSSSDIGPSRDDNILKRSETIKSSGGSNGDHSSSRRRQSKEIFPEPSGSRDTED